MYSVQRTEQGEDCLTGTRTGTSRIDFNTEKDMGRNKDMGKMALIRVETRAGTGLPLYSRTITMAAGTWIGTKAGTRNGTRTGTGTVTRTGTRLGQSGNKD
jgi:hypothetical protein